MGTRTHKESKMLQREVGRFVDVIDQPSRRADKDINLAGTTLEASHFQVSEQ